jgi:hypothetical protein
LAAVEAGVVEIRHLLKAQLGQAVKQSYGVLVQPRGHDLLEPRV